MIFLKKPKRRKSSYELWRSYWPVDDRVACVVPSCGVRSRRLDADGMCPPELWDVKHDDYARALRASERRTA